MRRLTMAALVVIGACGNGDGKGGGKGGDHDDPGLLGFARRTKKTEGELQVDHLAKASKAYFVEHGAFPKMKVGPTPSPSCCGSPGNKCVPNASDWIGTEWEQLDFRMVDGPFRYVYSYTGGGDTFTATATADLDCDDTNGATSFIARGRVVNGEPVVDFEKTGTE